MVFQFSQWIVITPPGQLVVPHNPTTFTGALQKGRHHEVAPDHRPADLRLHRQSVEVLAQGLQ